MNSSTPPKKPTDGRPARPKAGRQVSMTSANTPPRPTPAASAGAERQKNAANRSPRMTIAETGRQAATTASTVAPRNASPASTSRQERPSRPQRTSDTPATRSQRPSTASPSHSAPSPRKDAHRKQDPMRQPAPRQGVKKRRPQASRCNEDDGGGSTLVPSLLKAVIYIVSLLVVAGLLSYFAVTIGNDVFAFVKSDEPIQLTLTDEVDVSSLGEMLADYGIIRYPKIFDFYIGLRYGDALEFAPGDYTVTPSMGYDALVMTLIKSNREEIATVIVSIPEGFTVKQIINTLVNKHGLSSEEELTDAIQNADFDYWFIDELEKSGIGTDRKYRLEGYLYPDTYYYYSNASAETIINKMLKNFDTKLKNTFKNSAAPGDTYQEKILNLCKEREMSFDQIVTLASMIQMEAKFDYEYPKVSAVFNNRLRNPSATNGMLESCATVLYVLDIRVPILSDEQTKTDDPYNTYINKGLPPGAISNPTYLAINYALYPDMECGYYFFVAAPDGTSLFAKTQKQHEENIKLVKEMMEDS